MAKHAGRASQDKLEGNIQLASVDPTATPDVSGHGKSDEPFGLFTLVAPEGLVWFKWRKVAADIRAQEPALMRCLADATQCSPAAARFAAIVKEAREHEGRVRLNFVNQRVNNAIRYTSDMTQWGTPDEWSAPLAAGKGSFDTGLGDCEDYAIAKYVALRAAGIPAKQLRVLLVRDNIAHLDHAVLAANEDGHWYVLDNRWTAAVEDSDVRRFTPLFALDDQGVKLLAVPYASRIEPRIEPMSEVVKGGKGDQASQPSQGGISGRRVARVAAVRRSSRLCPTPRSFPRIAVRRTACFQAIIEEFGFVSPIGCPGGSIYLRLFPLAVLRNRTPGPPPFSSMNSTPPASNAPTNGESLADVMRVSFSAVSARRTVARLRSAFEPVQSAHQSKQRSSCSNLLTGDSELGLTRLDYHAMIHIRCD